MDHKFEGALDQIDVKILRELQKNARTSFSEIGRRVGLSSPAVTERVRKMEEVGIIRGYHAMVDPEKIGFPILAFVYLTTQSEKYNKVYSFARTTSEVMECLCISGNESFLLRVMTNSISHLDSLIEELAVFGETKTSIVLSAAVKKSYIEIE